MNQINSSGSIQALEKKPKSKCRKWRLRVNTGIRDFKTGTYRQVSRNFTGTYREAQVALRVFVDEIEQGKVTGRSKIRFGEYVDIWLAKRKEVIAYGTWQRNIGRSNVLRLHLENARLDEITPEVVENTYRAILDGGTLSGKKPSGTYGNDIARTLRNILNSAIEDGLIHENPCESVSSPAIDTAERKALSFAQMINLIAKLDPVDASQLGILLSIKTGMRRGEVCGLSWGDIDLENKTISIVHSYDDGGHLKEPKTKAGIRVIPITESVVNDLHQRKHHIEREFVRIREKLESISPSLGAETPVICNELGERQLPHSITRWWDRNRKSLGFDGWTVHEMRHSYLSEMARRNVDVKTLQTLAGHAKYQTTMNIYTHVSLEDKRRALEVVSW